MGGTRYIAQPLLLQNSMRRVHLQYLMLRPVIQRQTTWKNVCICPFLGMQLKVDSSLRMTYASAYCYST